MFRKERVNVQSLHNSQDSGEGRGSPGGRVLESMVKVAISSSHGPGSPHQTGAVAPFVSLNLSLRCYSHCLNGFFFSKGLCFKTQWLLH